MDCPSCQARVPTNEVRAARLIALCPTCDCTLELEEVDGVLKVASFREPHPPDGIRVELDRAPMLEQPTSYRDAMSETGGEFRASWRWWNPVAIFLTLFAFVWNSFLVTWYANIGSAPLIFYLFPLIHVAAGLGISWVALSMWVNKTQVAVRNGTLKTTHGPIPALFDKVKEVELDEVAVFVSELKKTSNRKGSPMWQINARMKDGRSVPVVTRMRSADVAEFLRKRLERQLSPAPGARVRVAVDERHELERDASKSQGREFEA